MLNTNRSNSSSRTGFAPTYFEYHGVDPGAYYGLAYRQVIVNFIKQILKHFRNLILNRIKIIHFSNNITFLIVLCLQLLFDSFVVAWLQNIEMIYRLKTTKMIFAVTQKKWILVNKMKYYDANIVSLNVSEHKHIQDDLKQGVIL